MKIYENIIYEYIIYVQRCKKILNRTKKLRYF